VADTEKTPAMLLNELAALDLRQRREVAAALRMVAETFAGIPDGRDTAQTRYGCWPTCSTPADGADTVLVLSAGRAASHSGGSNVCTGGARIRVKGPFSGRRGRQNLKCVRPDLEARLRAAGHEGKRRGLVHDDWL
jgi:hypothetical protein